jgi:hypothetical protein
MSESSKGNSENGKGSAFSDPAFSYPIIPLFFLIWLYLLIILLLNPQIPIRPAPINRIMEGSGTGWFVTSPLRTEPVEKAAGGTTTALVVNVKFMIPV